MLKGTITDAKLHNGVFCAGRNLGTALSNQAGAKQVAMSIVGSFLKVSIGRQSILVPFTNVSQITMIEDEPTPEKPTSEKNSKA